MDEWTTRSWTRVRLEIDTDWVGIKKQREGRWIYEATVNLLRVDVHAARIARHS